MTEYKVVDENDPLPPRTKRPNPLNYTELQMATRDMQLRDMGTAHPKIPYKWLEWLYDTIENKPKEEVDKIINEKLWEDPINLTRQMGGIIKGSMTVEPPPPVEEQTEEQKLKIEH